MIDYLKGGGNGYEGVKKKITEDLQPQKTCINKPRVAIKRRRGQFVIGEVLCLFSQFQQLLSSPFDLKRSELEGWLLLSSFLRLRIGAFIGNFVE